MALGLPTVKTCALLFFGLLAGCSSLDYYAQLAAGQWQLLRARTPINQIINDPQQPSTLRARLSAAQQARDFASHHLQLADNASYRSYVALDRPYVVWNLFATKPLSLNPVTYCFPIAGCVAYRGYFQLGRGRGAQALLKQQGLDTYLAGVEAYSTLGWFADPLLSSQLRRDDQQLAGVLFHELAHQRLYLPSDTAFSESFARFVEQEGLRQWRAFKQLTATDPQGEERLQAFTELVLASRQRLATLYASPLPDSAKQAGKQAEFARLRREYQALRDGPWQGDKRFDGWMFSPLNNAKLLPFALYNQWQPAFARLFAEQGGDWFKFYQAAEQLARLDAAERNRWLTRLNTGL